MQGNGFKVFLVVFFLALSGWYLFPSIQSWRLNSQLEELEGEDRDEWVQTNYSKLRNVQERALKLGLDLQGGMHVTLEVGLNQLIRELAENTDAAFDEVLAEAAERARTSDESLIDAFVDVFEERDPDARLSRYFRNTDAGISRRSTNAEVAEYLRQQAEDAITRAIEIIRNRVDRFGVTEPSIQRQGSRRIVVELPGVDDPERVRNLLKGTARLEFRLMAEPNDLYRTLQQVLEYYASGETPAAPDSAAADTVATDAAEDLPAVADAGDAAEDDSTFDVSALLDDDGASASTDNRLLALQTFDYATGPSTVFGSVAESDTAAFNRLMADPRVQQMLPRGVELMYSSKPIGTTPDGLEVYTILGVQQEAELTGDVITDARVDFNQANQAEVTMVMNSEGARTWARLTGANIGKQVAIVLDDVVYSDPVVQDRIVGGRSSITGLDSREEANDIVTVLKSGALPAPVQIVEERTVGPSLGQASIRAGFTSVLVGLMIVALFMIFYYRTGGMVADLALIINLIFILGILAGFGATLTLPGIAGIVLTIGMAVDANVLIFERIREEQATGKTLKASIEGGYAKALSAIIDANITTFFVGVILYSFGVGPIQGFAVTLMAGILASLFSAIVFTRILFDYMVLERRMQVSYG
ncbi:MAG: protein translocase subunit SecD [Rhodothermales bacterium]|nr:protein translocase subunit SecD [Rhodothermales bacterium]